MTAGAVAVAAGPGYLSVRLRIGRQPAEPGAELPETLAGGGRGGRSGAESQLRAGGGPGGDEPGSGPQGARSGLGTPGGILQQVIPGPAWRRGGLAALGAGPVGEHAPARPAPRRPPAEEPLSRAWPVRVRLQSLGTAGRPGAGLGVSGDPGLGGFGPRGAARESYALPEPEPVPLAARRRGEARCSLACPTRRALPRPSLRRGAPVGPLR